jgi:hypothetical protein
MRFLTAARATLLGVLLAAGSTGTASAQAAATPAKWENTVTLYGWAAGMAGTTGVGPAVASVDKSFSDVLSDLKMGAMLDYQGRGEKWVAIADFLYMKIGNDVAAPQSGTTIASITIKQFLLEGDAGYRIKPWLDALIGLRVPIIEGEVTPDVSIPQVSEKSGSQVWVAPIIGARAAIPFGKKFTGILRGDVGGFDIGGTNTTWQAAGYVNYGFGKGWSGTLGYRAIYANYKAGSSPEFVYDMTNYGPLFAISYTF